MFVTVGDKYDDGDQTLIASYVESITFGEISVDIPISLQRDDIYAPVAVGLTKAIISFTFKVGSNLLVNLQYKGLC